MRAMKIACLLICCGLAVTAQARPRVVPDQRLAVGDAEQGGVQLAQLGDAVLAGVVITDAAVAKRQLEALQAVEVKAWGADRYGRERIWLFAPGAAEPVQVTLLQQGAALAYDMAALPASWRRAEAQARTARRGVWATPPLSAAAVVPDVARFVRVAGTVTRTYKSRDTYYVNFGDDWKTDFSLAIPRRAWRAFGKALEVAPGTHIEARGVVVSENGPMIVLTRPEQWEVSHAHAR